MTDKVQKIREEVERLKSNLIRGACASQIAMETRCKEEAYNEVLAILDTLQEEPVSEEWIEELRTKLDSMSKEDFKKVFDKYAIDFNEEPVSEDLEKALLRLCPLPPCYNEEQRKSKDYVDSWWRARDEQNGFRLGAFWQKKNIIYIACEWLRNHLADYWDKENNYLNISGCIYEFREAMKSAKKGEPVEKDKLRALKEAYDRLKVMLNTSIDNEHFFEQLDDFIDELKRRTDDARDTL